MAAKPGAAAGAINPDGMKKLSLLIILSFGGMSFLHAQADSLNPYKKRVLESPEVDIMTSYYMQDGNNASVTGGRGTEKLQDFTPTIVVSVPLNEDDVLTVDGGISAYSSASSSNVDPFDGSGPAGPFQASSGASSNDVWFNGTVTYSHSSDDRNSIWNGKVSVSAEYDYTSLGFGGGYTRLFNEKNTELGVHGNVYLDSWHPVYPFELRPFANGRDGLQSGLFSRYTITGNTNYRPSFEEFANTSRNSYSVGVTFSQILSKRAQGMLLVDLVQQQGLLSTPFQRVYFSDVEDAFIENFHLAEDIEHLPDSRSKVAAGGRLNYYINQRLVVRTFYRFYQDDWGIQSHTANLELPIKLSQKYTIYPSYRFYNQTAADYFAPYNQHLSTETYYTSDYDLSGFFANEYGLGLTYTDIFTEKKIWRFGLKSIDVKLNHYRRNTSFNATIIAVGCKFIME